MMNVRHVTMRFITVFMLCLGVVSIILLSGCGSDSSQCTAPAGSTITVTGPDAFSIGADDTNFDFTVVVKYPDITPMPKACINISGAFAFPRNVAQLGWHYQFYYYPGGTNTANNVPVNSPFDAQTDDSGTYTFSALVSVSTGTFTDSVVVRSGTIVGTAAFTSN
jgi:hypothetical protein